MKTYTYKQLSKKARERALAEWIEGNTPPEYMHFDPIKVHENLMKENIATYNHNGSIYVPDYEDETCDNCGYSETD